MEDTSNESRRLFNEISADLRTHSPETVDHFKCPLCFDLFDAADADAKRITVEHIIPEALGGDSITLTCSRCNSGTDGKQIDSYLVKAMAACDGLEGRAPIRSNIHSDAGHVSANIILRSEPSATSEILIVGKASNPAGVEALRESMRDGGELKVTFNFQFALKKYLRVATRVAYLALFQLRGYSYVLSSGGEQVRSILRGIAPEQGLVLQAFPSISLPVPLLVLPFRKDGVSFYLVLMRLDSVATRHFAMLLPGEGGCDWSALRRIVTNPEGLVLEATPGGSPAIMVRFGPDPFLPWLKT